MPETRKFAQYLKCVTEERVDADEFPVIVPVIIDNVEKTSDNVKINNSPIIDKSENDIMANEKLIILIGELKESHIKEINVLKSMVVMLSEKIETLSKKQQINIPAPIIKLVIPENGKSVVKTIERDENGLIKSIKEEVNENLENRIIEGTIEIENKADYKLITLNKSKNKSSTKNKKSNGKSKK